MPSEFTTDQPVYHEVLLGKNGRIVIPASVRKSLDLKEGDRLNLKLEDDGIKLSSQMLALQNIHKALATKKTGKTNYVDEFLKWRKTQWDC